MNLLLLLVFGPMLLFFVGCVVAGLVSLVAWVFRKEK